MLTMIFVFQLIQADLYMQYILEFTTTLKNSLIENSTYFSSPSVPLNLLSTLAYHFVYKSHMCLSLMRIT